MHPVQIYSTKTFPVRKRMVVIYHLDLIIKDLGVKGKVNVYFGKVEGKVDPRVQSCNGAYSYVGGEHHIYIAARGDNTIHTLAHELRHAWQEENGTMEGYNFEIPWRKRPQEQDAEAYADRYCASL